MTVLVAVVGVTGTAYAGNHDSGDKKHGNDNSNGGRVIATAMAMAMGTRTSVTTRATRSTRGSVGPPMASLS